MARRFRLKDLLPGGRPKGPGFGIRQDFYLSVLACSPRLPALVEVLNPKGEEGAVTGFGVPLRSDAPKDSIREPLIRGRYGLASPDQK
ncbi:MAG: hypothetical protein MH204_01030, partial [Fimbriimonadaceae bacterium]|nr:hypothetical protein [Fimbriimonadaceae bacterium]